MSLTRHLFGLALSGLALTGLTAAPALGQTAQSKPLDHVSLRFGFIATGIDAVWTYGIQQNVFRHYGIDVDLRQGKGSAITAQTVASGADDFGVDIDGGTFLVLASKGLPATAILANAAKSALVVFSPASKPLKTPNDLIGKRIAITAGDGPSALLPVLLKRNGIARSKVNLINMEPGPKLASLLEGRVDGVATMSVLQPTLLAKGLKTYAMPYANFGVITPGMYMIASNKIIKQNPNLVRRFVAAAQKSMQLAAANPKAAARSFSARYPSYNRQGALGELKVLIGLFKSRRTQNKPLGTVSIRDAKAGAQVLAAAGLMRPGVDVSRFVTDRFVKSAANQAQGHVGH